MTDPAPLLELSHVSRIYAAGEQQVLALDDLSLSIPRGEFVAIVGASGSGKSTLMNLIGCLDRPTSGTIRWAGEDLAGVDSDRLAEIRNQRIGFVFQTFQLLPRTSALENVELPLFYADVRSSERHARARQALQRVGLSDREHHTPNQLSGGQQQRVAIARALIMEPELILADEPTGNLDSKRAVEIMALFAGLWRSGMTIVMVTHEPEIAAYAERVLTMRDGLLISDQKQAPATASPSATK